MSPRFGDALRVVPVILWVALVGVGVAYLNVSRPVAGDLHAIKSDRTLPQNTLLLSDMLITDWTGRYLVKPGGVKAGEIIKDADVGNEPVLPTPPPARFLAVIPVERTRVGPLNAGSRVQLCGDASITSISVTVLYVRCAGSKTSQECSATVELPRDSLKSLAGYAASVKALQLSDTCT